MHSSVPPQIPGELVPNQDAQELRQIVADLLERDNTRFPGAQPVSFAREHLQELQKEEYFMCEKTDGVRCLLFLYFQEASPGTFVPVTFLVDRKNNYYQVNPSLRYPYYKDPKDADKYLFNTILDGELVNDRWQDPATGQWGTRLIFYVFDCLVIDGIKYTHRTLDKRWGYMQAQIFQPYESWLRHHNGVPPGGREPFRVKQKQMYPPYSLSDMFDKILPNLPHGNDGLVFTCKRTPYKFGTDPNILKWKPPHENTIDFKLRLGDFPLYDPEDGEEGLIPDYEAAPTMQLLVSHGGSNYQVFADLYFTPQEWVILKGLNQRLDGRIIECYRDDNGRWRFKPEADGSPRWRDDKKDANHISTVKSVLESIEDPVTEDDLLRASPAIKEAVKRFRAEEEERHQAALRDLAQRESKKRKLSESVNGGS